MQNKNICMNPEKRARIRDPESKGRFRQQLLAEAKSLYQNSGYEAVSVRAVTKAAGISPMAFYGYFVSKQDLVKHIWLDFFSELFEHLEKAGRGKRSPVDVLTAHVDAYIGYWVAHPDRYRMVYLSSGTDGETASIRFDEGDVVAYQLLMLTRQRIAACACGRPIADEQVRMQTDMLFIKSLGYLHGVLTVGRYPFEDIDALKDSLVSDIVDNITRAIQ
jgi:AcrR family transcriptional regulator